MKTPAREKRHSQPVIMIGNKKIGGDEPCFIIAEIGINHNNDINIAKKLIDITAEAGCDAVKFQAFKAERMYPKTAGEIKWKDDKNEYSYDIFDANKSFELPDGWWPELRDYAKSKGLVFFSSVCDEETGDQVAKYLDILKTTSFAITRLPLLKHLAKMGKPLMFSTGTAVKDEIKEAYAAVKDFNKEIIILHCISEYPMLLEHTNIISVENLQKMFPNAVIGFSDHSAEPMDAPVAAIAYGAKVIEKHITLDRQMQGPDHFFALEPAMLKQMVQAIRKTEQELAQGRRITVDKKLIGEKERKLDEKEQYIRVFCRESVMTKRAMKKGEVLTVNDIIVLRNATKKPGLHPRWYEIILAGKYALTRDVEKEHPLQKNDIKKMK
jgi:sialic acid synthase SpsE